MGPLFPEVEAARAGAVSFFVPGKAQTKGSQIPFMRRDGSLGVRNDNPAEAGWHTTIGWYARRAMAGRPLFDGPLRLTLVITRVRPAGHFSARGGLLPSAPPFPHTKPDMDKTLRSVGDALTGVIWRDDALVVTGDIRKRYGAEAGIRVIVQPEEAP